jgi:hypothetical protein
MSASQWVASTAPTLLAFVGGMFLWRSLKRKQDAEAGHSVSEALGGYVTLTAELRDQIDQMWQERNEARKEAEAAVQLVAETQSLIKQMEYRIGKLEAEVIRLGGDPAKLNGWH